MGIAVFRRGRPFILRQKIGFSQQENEQKYLG
jgi:hypothetical protein